LELANADPPDTRGALNAMNALIAKRGDRLTGYDKGTIYEIRGTFKVQLDDIPGALRDYETAVATNALPLVRSNLLRYNIAQINYQLENYDAAIAGLREWLRVACGEPPANAYYLIALGYIQKEDFRSAEQPMETALRLKKKEDSAASKAPDKNYYSILNLIYSNLRKYDKWANHLETMINIWPDDSALWGQLTSAYAIQKKDNEAFSVLEVAYRAGLLTTSQQVLQLVQYYSFFENAYRGAKLLEREMNAGVVERSRDNLILLSQLWDQSREAKKAIPILEEAAKVSGQGELYFRLGRVLVADEQYAKADRILLQAINSGNLKESDRADAWLLLGNARFSAADTQDRAALRRAREAFQRAARFPRTRRSAQSYITYINEVIRVQELQLEREKEERRQICDNALDRLKDAQRINQLQGRDITDLSNALSSDLKDCGYDNSGNPIPGSSAATERSSEGEGE